MPAFTHYIILATLLTLISGPLAAKGFNSLNPDIFQCVFEGEEDKQKKKPVPPEGEQAAEAEEEDEEPDCE